MAQVWQWAPRLDSGDPEPEPVRHVLIIEPHDDLAAAFEQVVASADFNPIVRRHVASMADLGVTPIAMVVRIGHGDISTLPPDRPPIVAIVTSDEEAAEAKRLRCEIILRAPSEIRRLCEALRTLSVL
jgi:hypothetical protein